MPTILEYKLFSSILSLNAGPVFNLWYMTGNMVVSGIKSRWSIGSMGKEQGCNHPVHCRYIEIFFLSGADVADLKGSGFLVELRHSYDSH